MTTVNARFIAAILAAVCLCCSEPSRGEIQIRLKIEPGKPFSTLDGTTCAEDERFLVSPSHQIPDDMVVQGDTVVLHATGTGLERATDVRWSLQQAAGRPKLAAVPGNPLTARLLADGYGENTVEFAAIVDGEPVTQQTTVRVEFSSGNMLVTHEAVSLPPDVESNLFVRPFELAIQDHREQVTARNPKTGRLVTLWQVKFGRSDASPMGVGVMVSDDHGLSWKDKKFLFLHESSNSGWGSIGWNPFGNGGEGELLLWTCSHVRSDANRLMLFRSRDNGESWQHAGDYQDEIARQFGFANAKLVYFGVNRTIATTRGTLVAPMVAHHYAQALWSNDAGLHWQVGDLDRSFPRGDEDAVVETADGGRLILMARPPQGDHNRRYESTDGGKRWTAAPDSSLPTARVNFGLDRIDELGSPYHGRIVYPNVAKNLASGGSLKTFEDLQ